MSRQEFLEKLRKGLLGLPQDDVEERLTFYSEMIEDRMEEGFTEEEAVGEIGSVDEIITQIIEEIPLAKLVKEKMKPKRRLGAWEIVLLVLGSPLWFSLLVAAFAVVFSIYVALWSVIVSLWAAEVSLWGTVLGCIVAGVIFAFTGNGLTGAAMIGASLICAGLSAFLFFGCKFATKGAAWLTKKMALRIKNCFIKKEDA